MRNKTTLMEISFQRINGEQIEFQILNMQELLIFNAREHKSQIDEFKLQGFDINDGFIVRVDNINIYQGVDAILFLNTLTKNRVYFPDNYFFRNIVYPMIKYLRKFILLITIKKTNI